MAVHQLRSCLGILDISAWTKVMDWHCHPWCRDWRIPPSITYRDFCLSTRLLISGSAVVIFSVEAMSPSPACVCQPATSTRPKKRRLIQLTRCTRLPLHVSCKQLDLEVWTQSDSRTSRPLSALLPPTVCVCARDDARHVTAACLSVRAQRPADHLQRLLLLVLSPWSRWVVIKLHLTFIPHKLSLLWISQLVCGL